MTQEVSDAGHVLSWIDAGWMLDQCQCSCGWMSHPYFDGAEYAEAEWKKHVRDSAAIAQPGVPA